MQWLRADLAANTKPCTAAYWHHARFSRGDHGDDTSVRTFFLALYDNKLGRPPATCTSDPAV